MGRRFGSLGVLLAVLWASPAVAQSVNLATLQGTVVDESGGVLPGVPVTVTQTDTGFTRFVVTGAQGGFVFNNLPIGPYRLTAQLDGFRAFEQSGITLNIGDTRSVTVVMVLGAMSETVTVSADASLVQTQSLSVGQVTSQEVIVGLPLDGRQATQLLVLEGGAVQGGGTAGNRGFPGQVAISVAGGTPNSTQYLVDGGYNNDPQRNAGNIIPFPDALAEFRTESGVRDARYGMSTGATVNAVTRSGSNTFHGNVFNFARNYRFNALEFFDRPENGGPGGNDGLNRNQFGGTFGGPILREQLFFFVGIQGTVNEVTPTSSNNTVPTAAMRAGDFRQVMSAACRGTDRTLGPPFVGNQIDPKLFHPISLRLLEFVPLPDPALDADGCGRYVLRVTGDSKDQQYVTRVDWNLAANKRVFVRDFLAHFKNPARFNDRNLIIAQRDGGNVADSHTIASGLDWVLSQNLFSTTRISYQHTRATRESGVSADGTQVPTLADLGVNSWNYHRGAVLGQNQLKSGVFSTGNTGLFFVDTPQFSQDFDWILGSHSLSFGGSWTRPSSDGDGPFQADGNMSFNGTVSSSNGQGSGGLSLADFMLGYSSRYRLGGSQINNAVVHSPGIYFNDIWRVNQRFTINYGLRWEPFLAPKDRNDFVTGWLRENFDQGIRSTVYPNAPIGLVFRGDPGFPDNGANSFNQYNQLAPRFGIVWDPAGDARQTIRSGFGIYYDSPQLWITAHHMLNAPFGNTVDAVRPASCPNVVKRAQNNCPIDYANPWSATPGGDPLADFPHHTEPVRLPASTAAFPSNGVYVSMPAEANPMRSYQYNLSYQRQLAPRVLLDVTYTGNQQQHIWVAGYAENPAVYIPGNCAPGEYPGVTAAAPACSNTSAANIQARGILRLLNPVEGAMYSVNTGGMTGISQLYMDGRGHYNGLKVALQKRMGDGWSASANYTLSKCVNQGDPSTDIGWSIPIALKDPYNDPHPDPKSAEGACATDRRHVLNVTGVLLSPGIGEGFLNVLTKDWQVGLIFQKRSGSPLSPGLSDDFALTDEPGQRPVIVAGVDPYLDEPVWIPDAAGFNTRLRWINMDAFANPALGQRGDAKRGTIYGPGFWNADLAFSRILSLGGERRIELRVEAFNLFNHVNWANPNVTVDSNNAGLITNTSGDARIMQFAVKYGF